MFTVSGSPHPTTPICCCRLHLRFASSFLASIATERRVRLLLELGCCWEALLALTILNRFCSSAGREKRKNKGSHVVFWYRHSFSLFDDFLRYPFRPYLSRVSSLVLCFFIGFFLFLMSCTFATPFLVSFFLRPFFPFYRVFMHVFAL
jgi:hypothetical protein